MSLASRRVERRVYNVQVWERESRMSEWCGLCIRGPCCMPVNGHSLSLYSRNCPSTNVMVCYVCLRLSPRALARTALWSAEIETPPASIYAGRVEQHICHFLLA